MSYKKAKTLPEQKVPFPVNPTLQEQVLVTLLQIAFVWQLLLHASFEAARKEILDNHKIFQE